MNTQNKSEKKRQTYLLAGNGFDIALGLKTKYSDFFMVVGIIIALDVYQSFRIDGYDFDDVKKRKKSVTDQVEMIFEDLNECNYFEYLGNYEIEHIDKEYYKKITEIALDYYISSDYNSINNYKNSIKSPFYLDFIEQIFPELVPYLKEDNSSYVNFANKYRWLFLSSNLEDDKQHLKDYDVAKLKSYKYLPRFIQILNGYIQNSEYQNWMDLESFIELLVTGNEYLKSKFEITNDQEPKYLFNEHKKAQEYSDGLEKFCLMFEKYISLINKYIPEKYDLDDIISPYKESFQKRNKGEDINLLDISNVDAVLSYNYTDTFGKLFPKLSENGCVYYINGKVSGDFASPRKESQIVFGYTRNNKDIDVSPKCLIFEKDKQRFLKNIQMYDYKKILEKDEFNIVIFGHSCSPADGDVFRSILNHPKLNKAVICCYNKDAMTSAYENLVKMLDESPSCETTINDLIINKKVLFCLNEESHAEND